MMDALELQIEFNFRRNDQPEAMLIRVGLNKFEAREILFHKTLQCARKVYSTYTASAKHGVHAFAATVTCQVGKIRPTILQFSHFRTNCSVYLQANGFAQLHAHAFPQSERSYR
ncbi:MAG: hypothetical protein C0456_02065 [Hyphomonas sp.]|nr:hypothetical protein [Hyphomonas sp.]